MSLLCRRSIILANDGLVYRRIYSPSDFNNLTHHLLNDSKEILSSKPCSSFDRPIPGNTREYEGNHNKYFCNTSNANDNDLKIRWHLPLV